MIGCASPSSFVIVLCVSFLLHFQVFLLAFRNRDKHRDSHSLQLPETLSPVSAFPSIQLAPSPSKAITTRIDTTPTTPLRPTCLLPSLTGQIDSPAGTARPVSCYSTDPPP